MDIPNINERIKVFVSSAMGNENDPETNEEFNWIEFRNKVKKRLEKCKYIQAFTIEDYASSVKSNDFMIANVDKSDIVILLIKNDFRAGTRIEYSRCRETNKPLLVFFFGDESADDEVKKLRKDLQQSDYCTYKKMNDFENAEAIISDAVIQDVISYYHNIFRNDSFYQPIDIEGVPIDKTYENNNFMPTKKVLAHFESCYNTIYKYMNMPKFVKSNPEEDKTEFHDIGEKIIRWIINGDCFLSSDDKSRLVSLVSEKGNEKEWYHKRLDAIDYFIQGNINQAYNCEKEALRIAEETNTDEWIITNILIDLRNLQYLCPRESIDSDEEYQNRLDSLDSIVHVPVLDRYLENTYETLIHEEIKRNTASIGTIFIGNKIDEIVTGLENYLFTSFLYGSYTHILLTRKAFSNVLYRLGKLYSVSELIFNAVKLFLFSDQYSDYVRISNLEWDSISQLMILNADELWNQAYGINEITKDTICMGLLYRIGLYLNERSFVQAEKYMLTLSSTIKADCSEKFLDCILNICGRMKQENALRILINILETHRYITAGRLTQLIGCINYETVPDELLNQLFELLKKDFAHIVNENGDPQCLAALVNIKPGIFSELVTLPNNGLIGEQKLLFELNTGSGDWNAVIKMEIEIAKKQFYANNQKGVYCEFATNPYSMISQAFDNDPPPEITNTLEELFFPFCIEVLNSDCSVVTKDQCAECLCIVLGYYTKNNINIPEEVINCITAVSKEISSGNTLSFRSSEALWCRLISLKIIVGVLDKNILIQWCLSYSKKDYKERLALIQCILSYLQYCKDIDTDIDLLIVSIIFNCCEDYNVSIRTIACECLWYLLDSQFNKQTEEKINKVVYDSAPVIKSRLLKICRKNWPDQRKIINQIIICLINDSNYMIKEQAKKLLELTLEPQT